MATTWFPEHIGVGCYKELVMEIEALRQCSVLDRFGSERAMCEWLSHLLGWEVNYRAYNVARTRFQGRSNDKEDPDRYLFLLDFYREQTRKYHEVKQKIMAELILSTNVNKIAENKQ